MEFPKSKCHRDMVCVSEALSGSEIYKCSPPSLSASLSSLTIRVELQKMRIGDIWRVVRSSFLKHHAFDDMEKQLLVFQSRYPTRVWLL
jgi:hypothetical protein